MKYEKSLLSILVPVYNAESYLGEALASIKAQTFKNFEVLIRDDCSDDRSREVVEGFKSEFERIRIFRNHENLGKAETVNRLVQDSMGEYLTIHDADDISFPNRFYEVVSFLERYSNVAMCGHEIQRITEKGRPLQLFRRKTTDFHSITRNMMKDNTDGDSSLVFRRNILQKVSPLYRPYFKNNMDYDFALRVIANFEASNIAKVLMYYRNVPSSISKKIDSYHKLVTQGMTKFFYEERQNGGIDSLDKGNWELISQKEKELARPYLDNKSLYLRQTAERMFYYQMRKEAILYSIKAIVKEPFDFRNTRTLLYCIRKRFS